MLRCDCCGWECEVGTLVRPPFSARFTHGSLHVCPRDPGYGIMREVESADDTPTPEAGNGG